MYMKVIQADLTMQDYKGFRLCNRCWNGQHWIIGVNGKPTKTSACHGYGCTCPCRDMKPPVTAKFTGEGQTEIDMTDALTIGKGSTANSQLCPWCMEAHEGGPDKCVKTG